MFPFGNNPSSSAEPSWRSQLDRFAKTHQPELAALAWGLWLQNGDRQGTLGLDLKPTPHFVYCPKSAIEQLNRQTDSKLQEVLGIVDNHQPEVEVLIIGIGDGQIKLIQFEPQPPPPACFEQMGLSVDALLDRLEQELSQQVQC